MNTNDTYEFTTVHLGASLFWIIVGALVGFLIGRSKDRPVLGFFFGLILGCIGWIIMLIIPAKVAKGLVAGWHQDPYGRHQQRYFNGVTWQAQVSDNGVQSIDDFKDSSGQVPPAPQ